jgi:hypothetical protein
MKHIHTFESFLNEGKMSIEQVIELLKKEMRWNNPTVEPVSDDDLKMYSHIKNLSKDNGIMYHGLPGESLIKDFKTIFKQQSYTGYMTNSTRLNLAIVMEAYGMMLC